MTTLNINIDEKKKKKLKELANISEDKTISNFVRTAIEQKMVVEEKFQDKKVEIEIPEYIPDGKYVAIVRNTIVGIGDSPSELIMEISSKFMEDSIAIRKKGKKDKPLEYVFLAEQLKCWEYLNYENKTYPTIPFEIKSEKETISGRALIDTAASLTVVDKKIISKLSLKEKRSEEIFSIDGIKTLPIFEFELILVDFKKKIEIVTTSLSDKFPFQILLGRNFLDFLDLFLYGKNQIICFKPS